MAAGVLDTRPPGPLASPLPLGCHVDARSALPVPRDMLAHARIALTYAWRHRRAPRLADPMLFTEWVQHRKLHDRDPRLPRLADKLLVKAEVAGLIGPEWVTPTLWHGTALPPCPRWPAPFVVKSRHGSNQTLFVRSPDIDWPALRRRAGRWMAGRYGVWLDEWLYGEIERGLLVEPFIGSDGTLPIDYKLHVFAGRVAVIEVHLQRETAHRWLMLDRDWRPVDRHLDAPPRPRSLARMIEGAETLACDHDYVRVDLYEIAGHPRFGEFTFYPGSGLHPIHPPGLDRTMGTMWREARVGR